MSNLSDAIEEFLKNKMSESIKKEILIKRNELANKFSCAPSQINYVLTTRFTVTKGYYVESKRGGGGCIIIKKMCYEDLNLDVNHILDMIDNELTYEKGVNAINSLLELGLINKREADIMKASINVVNKNDIRSNVLKSMLMVIFI